MQPSAYIDLAALPAEELPSLAAAGDEVLACYRAASEAGEHLLAPLFRDTPFRDDVRYPAPDGTRDPVSDARYYFHVHPDQRHGHFHTFMGSRGMPPGVTPAPAPLVNLWPQGNAAYSHVVGITIDDLGLPIELFTVNRWVAGEAFYRAEDVRRMLPRFELPASSPGVTAVDRWVVAILRLFRPHIGRLLDDRDAVLAEYKRTHPVALVHEVEEIVFPSRVAVDLDEHLGDVHRALARSGDRPLGARTKSA